MSFHPDTSKSRYHTIFLKDKWCESEFSTKFAIRGYELISRHTSLTWVLVLVIPGCKKQQKNKFANRSESDVAIIEYTIQGLPLFNSRSTTSLPLANYSTGCRIILVSAFEKVRYPV